MRFAQGKKVGVLAALDRQRPSETRNLYKRSARLPFAGEGAPPLRSEKSLIFASMERNEVSASFISSRDFSDSWIDIRSSLRNTRSTVSIWSAGIMFRGLRYTL